MNKGQFPSVKNVAKKLWKTLTNNLGLKLFSVLCAFILWMVVVSSSSTITRDRSVQSDILVTGQSTLSSRGLSLLTDSTSFAPAWVRVRVAQSNYSLVNSDNVRVDLDLSSIRTDGKQSVRLRGSTAYGTVVGVRPEYVDIVVESQDQRFVPVNTQISQQESGYWYNVTRVNPTYITVTGPSSLVREVSSATVDLNLTGRYENQSMISSYRLLDNSGAEVSENLSKSASSVTVSFEVYPTKEIPVDKEPASILAGQIADGYRVAGIEITPATVVLAADKTLLESLDKLTAKPVNIEGLTHTENFITEINTIAEMRHLSTEEIRVTVTVEEIDETNKQQEE